MEDRSPEPAFSTVATISLWGSGLVHAEAISHSPIMIPVKWRFVIVSANPDQKFAYPRLPERT